MMCVCATGHSSMVYVQIRMWWSSNLGQKPLHNLGSVDYCYAYILEPPHLLFPPSNVLLGVAYPSCPKTPPLKSIVSQHRIIC